MKEIQLTKGMVAKVSNDDYEWLSKMGKWQFDRYAYCTRKVNGKRKSVRMHRLILNPPEGMVVDHINGDKLDNRRSNLRAVPQSVNALNRHCGKKDGSSSKYYGVFWDNSKGKWRAMVSRVVIGRYPTEELAAKAYDKHISENGIVAPTNGMG